MARCRQQRSFVTYSHDSSTAAWYLICAAQHRSLPNNLARSHSVQVIMPEIGEVARVVHYIKKHLGGRTLASVKVQEDDNVYGKAGCSAGKFQKAMTGKKVLDARQQGKYFW